MISKVIIFTLASLICSNICYGYEEFDKLKFNHRLPPGSYKIEYYGLKGRLYKEANRFIIREWRNQQDVLLNRAAIDVIEYNRRHTQLNLAIQDSRTGRWWDRDWYHSLSVERGGVSIDVKTISIGRVFTIFDAGLFTLNNAFDFKFKEYSKKIQLSSQNGLRENVKDTWLFRFRPSTSFSFSRFLKNPIKIVRKAGFSSSIIYFRKDVPVIELQIVGGYNFGRSDLRFYFQIQLLQW